MVDGVVCRLHREPISLPASELQSKGQGNGLQLTCRSRTIQGKPVQRIGRRGKRTGAAGNQCPSEVPVTPVRIYQFAHGVGLLA